MLDLNLELIQVTLIKLLKEVFLAHILFAIASIISLTSFLMVNILYLRLCVVVANVIVIFSGIMFKNYSLIGWSFGYIIINIVQIFLLFFAKKPILLPAHLKDIFPYFYGSLTTRELLRLSKHAQVRVLKKDEVLIKKNDTPVGIGMILKGQLIVQLNNKRFITLEKGTFVGEISYFCKQETNATIYAPVQNVEVLFWDVISLDRLKEKNKGLFNNLYQAVSLSAFKKLESNNKLF